MTVYHKLQPGEIILGKLTFGVDLLEELTAVCEANNIVLGRVEALGAVQKARLGFYDQQQQTYNFFEIDQELEIASLIGNISIRDGKPMVHAHATFTDAAGAAYGGHLAPGTIVFACEFAIQSLAGPEYRRGSDEETGLPLWDI